MNTWNRCNCWSEWDFNELSGFFGNQEPLNSGDDVSDAEDQELFDTENVVVCQYDKVGDERQQERTFSRQFWTLLLAPQIHRSKNKWKFHLKDGIMNLNGRDYVFSKSIGDAEWWGGRETAKTKNS